MKFSNMEYSRVDFGGLAEQVRKITERIKYAGNAQEQFDCIREVSAIMEEPYTMENLVYVRYTVNTADEFYKKEMEYCNKESSVLSAAMQEYEYALMESPFRKELEEHMGSYYFERLEMGKRSFSPEISELIQEEGRLAATYQGVLGAAEVKFEGKKYSIPEMGEFTQSRNRAVRKAAFEALGRCYEDLHDMFDSIFDALVKNRTAQAHKLGLKDYVELAYLRHRRCFTVEDAGNFRKMALEDLLPIVWRLKKAQAERIGVDELAYYDIGYKFADGNAVPRGTSDEILAAGKRMYMELSQDTDVFIREMFSNEMFDVLAKPGKTAGGYCIQLPKYKSPFIFANFNGTAGDVDVFTHEAGHAYAFYCAAREIELAELRSPTAEACEVHSMSMEFFTAPWYKTFFGKQAAKYEYAHLESALDLILRGCMADHFQEEIYSRPEMTPDERNDLWNELEHLYRPYVHSEGLIFYERGADWQRQHHFFTHPYYYIDYSLAQVVSLELWVEMEKDWNRAWEQYQKFISYGGTKSFIGLVESAGLTSPMEKGCLKEIAEYSEKWLEKRYADIKQQGDFNHEIFRNAVQTH